ncbi:MAG: hypothetical protein IJR66_03370 [Clostridia bacterium]|nr:hypothetical protein [Clostridia bacterium]MBQ9513999.1 hypothetical protein [Clostridia bacterium]
MKKILILILSLIFILQAAACGNKKQNNYDLEIQCFDWAVYDGATEDSIMTALKEKTGVNFYFSGINGQDAYNKQLKMNINTGAAPEVFFYAFGTDTSDVNFWAEEGIIQPLDDYLDDYPNLKTLLNSNQYKNLIASDGKHYFIPRLTTANNWGIYMRKDWIANLQNRGGQYSDVKYPADDGSFTIKDFEYLLEAFTLGDPDGNGKNDTFGLTLGEQLFWGLPMMYAFCDYGWTITGNQNNKDLTYSYTTQDFKNYINWMAKMYKLGYIDKTYYENTTDEAKVAKFQRGKYGMLIANTGSFVPWILSNAVFSADDVMFIAPPKGTSDIGRNGSGGFMNFGGWWGGFFISHNCNNIRNALKLFDYIYSVEGSRLINYGIEGVHYDIGEEGEIVANLEGRNKEPENTFSKAKDENGKEVNIGYVYWANYITLPISEFSTDKITVLDTFEGYKPEEKRLATESAKMSNNHLRPINDLNQSIFNFSGWSEDFSINTSEMDDLVSIYATCMITGNSYEGTSGIDNLWNKLQNAISSKVALCKSDGISTLQSLGKW